MEIGVYRLEPFAFAKKFVRSNPRAFPQFHPELFTAPRKWSAPRLAAKWKVQKLVGDVSPENDFPCEGVSADFIPLFSPRAVDGLRDFLEPNGELLPVSTPLGTYYAYNVTTIVNVVDVRKSKMLPLGQEWDVVVFRADRVKGLTIFKLPQIPKHIYVTEPFVQRVRELGFQGMWLTKIWPIPKGTRWQNERGKEFQRQRDEAERQVNQLRFPKLKASKRAPRVLDLRKDVQAIEKLLQRASKWAQRQTWKTSGEAISAIGLEIMGWAVAGGGGPLIMCHLDTRDVHRRDDVWTHFSVARLARPQWSALIDALCDSEVERTVIDPSGRRHVVCGEDAPVMKLFSNTLVSAMKRARERGVFRDLLKRRKCRLVIQNHDRGFYWSPRV